MPSARARPDNSERPRATDSKPRASTTFRPHSMSRGQVLTSSSHTRQGVFVADARFAWFQTSYLMRSPTMQGSGERPQTRQSDETQPSPTDGYQRNRDA